MRVNTSNQVQLLLLQRDNVTLGTVTLGTAYSGQQWRVAAQSEGSTLRMKAWPTAGLEPLDWDISVVLEAPFGAGSPGIRSGVGTGNSNAKPVLFRYDDYELRLPRFFGEVAKWEPSRELGEVNRTVAVEMSGVTRRLGQGKNPLRSASYRHITTTTSLTPINYWPLDEQPDATVLGADVYGGNKAEFEQTLDVNNVLSGAIRWGAASGLPGIERGVELTGVGELHLPVDSGAIGSIWTVSWVQKLSQAAGGFVRLRSVIPADDVFFTFFTDGTYLVQVGTGLSFTTIFSGQLALAGYDDAWHTFSLTAWNNTGTTCTYRLAVDGNGPTSTALSPITFSQLKKITFVGGDIGTTTPGAFAQAVVCAQDNATNNIPADLYTVAYGNSQENAVFRLERLCTEEGVTSDRRGDKFLTPFMGPQSVKTLLQLVDECITVDRGARFEPKGAAGIGIRTLNSMLNQTPAVALDYAAGYVELPFQPVNDDQAIVNDVTAKRPNGGQSQYVRTDGPRNVADPGTLAGAVGRVAMPVDVNTQTDAQLPEQASFRVQQGTVPTPRIPTLSVNMATPAMTNAIAAQLMDVAPDDLVTVDNADAAGLYDLARLIALGYTETLDSAYLHKIAFNCSPADIYDVVVLDTSRLAGGTDHGNPSTITVARNTVDTALTVASTGYLWSTTDEPYDCNLNGEKVTATVTTGVASPQAITVTRSGNSVVKSHAAGAPLELLSPRRLAPS
jgi:hypothetical protein